MVELARKVLEAALSRITCCSNVAMKTRVRSLVVEFLISHAAPANLFPMEEIGSLTK